MQTNAGFLEEVIGCWAELQWSCFEEKFLRNWNKLKQMGEIFSNIFCQHWKKDVLDRVFKEIETKILK